MHALILVDIQNDFCPGGALAVPDGDAVVAVANDLMRSAEFDLVVATQDWHPSDHGSFAIHHPGSSPYQVVDLSGLPQVLWPVHCVQGSPGAAFHPQLLTSRIDAIFQKGQDKSVDSYSGFFDNGKRRDTGLNAWLRSRAIDTVTVVGLATDYCVKFTALDAASLGYRTLIRTSATRGVELTPGDSERALAALREAGVTVVA